MIGKLLIVEDQMLFRKGLMKMLEQNSLGWTVVGEAENGQHAIEMLDELRPDLILTDIRMPLLDGIGLAEYIYKHKKEIAVIILTGYEDFKYAQSALKFGAIDFLLKPCNEQVLKEVLQRAYDHFREAALAKARHLTERHAMEEHVLRSILLRLPCDEQLVARVREAYGSYQIFMLQVNDYFPEARQYKENDLELLQFALFNIVSELSEQSCSHYRLISLEFDQFALLLETVNDEPQALSEAIFAAVGQYLGLAVTIYQGGAMKEVAYQLPVSAPVELSSAPHTINQAKIKEMHTRLATGIMFGNIGEIKSQLQDILSKLAKKPVESAKVDALIFAKALQQTYKGFLTEENGQLDMGLQMNRLQAASTSDQLLQWAEELAKQFIACFQTWQANMNNNVIDKTLNYIEHNYMETCGLSTVAEMFHMSVTYFSKLFKKETGETYTNYLTKVRMEKAKLLLCNTDMKMFEIASAVGFNDPNYFTNVFNRTQNVSPTEFRRLHQ
ncbi:response regulator transcription factor [Paenibacillus sp. GXUN7292]|uniref:response regulator transcription factor n=1 Tax=Paenibacillus sp. GXUN7292 TaxID=3422499 RepID=UPI003D7D276D